MNKFKELCEVLTKEIQKSYEEGVTVEEAERLAGKFLHAQLVVSGELKKADLDARMKKSGLKAVKAAVYLAEVQSVEKKPSDVLLQAKVDTDKMVMDETESMDQAEVLRDELDRYYSIFKEAHIFMRGIAKGRLD